MQIQELHTCYADGSKRFSMRWMHWFSVLQLDCSWPSSCQNVEGRPSTTLNSPVHRPSLYTRGHFLSVSVTADCLANTVFRHQNHVTTKTRHSYQNVLTWFCCSDTQDCVQRYWNVEYVNVFLVTVRKKKRVIIKSSGDYNCEFLASNIYSFFYKFCFLRNHVWTIALA